MESNRNNEITYLTESIRNMLAGDGLLFLGAGIGKSLIGAKGKSLPVGSELSDQLGKDCGIGDGYTLDVISEYFLESKSETSLINALRKHLKINELSSHFESVVKNPWKRIWTTNYDDSVEIALKDRSHKTITLSDDPNNARSKSLLVVHINGALKRLGQSIPEDFIISSQHYSTDYFNDSVWSAIFKNDLKTARSIFFVGYSLYDLDIARTLFNPEQLNQKIHFIDHEGIDPVLKLKLSKFGTVHTIGVEGFSGLIEKQRESWIEPEYVEQYDTLRKVEISTDTNTPGDNDFYDLVLKGIVNPTHLATQSDEPENARYTIYRDCEQKCIDHLGLMNTVGLIIGGFANGKTITTESVALQVAAQGRDVFVLDRPTTHTETEIENLCRRDSPFVLVIENYSRNLEFVRQFFLFARDDSSLLISEKTEIHELRAPALFNISENWEVAIFDLDLLENIEISRAVQLLDHRGVWGEKAGLTEVQKMSFLKEDCGRQMHAIMLEVIRSPDIKKRLEDIVEHFTSIEDGEDMMICLCLLQAIGELPRVDVAAELLQLSSSSFRRLIENKTIRQIISVQSGVAAFRSPVVASSILEGFSSASKITRIVIRCAKRGEFEKRVDPYLGEISVSLLRFGNLERILPSHGKRAALQNLYEELKNVDSIRLNPLFWLQYAMARLSLGEIEYARRNFEQSYAIAKKTKFDTYQIDNHFCRLLLAEAEISTDPDEAFKNVQETLNILKRQVLRENRHYPYRSAWNLDGVSRRHSSAWTDDQKRVVIGGAKHLIDAAERLDHKLARSTSVVGGLQRLNRVIRELSDTVVDVND